MQVNSSSTAYATAAQLVTRYDANTLGELVNDDGTKATGGTLTSHANLAVALADASGFVESACLRGQRYSPGDLAALAAGATVGGSLLQKLVCGLAMWSLMDRRSMRTLMQPTPLPEWIKTHLDALATGEAIFGFAEVEAAGVAEVVTRQTTDAANPDRITERARRFFGDRSSGRA